MHTYELPEPMPEFAHIADIRDRLLARINWSLRAGTADDAGDALVADLIRSGAINLTDLERDCVARYLVTMLEDELGKPVDQW